ncbi:serine/threonine-protein kinase [Hirsutella rhossiliensis]|uniref:non-specific serine/threonine protein kinase n=1 Tax=Hirsutella rhossiliensis TaxID=111463 RepID=A0A9P8MVK3_9HYPO|nr:serine/threonine-protein kinase [Hirsutella rhossiliensis]KAH0962065.1 serine/threonine-protein kinase [Hirsutella rhossiliensis]
MTDQNRSKIIKDFPIGNGLDVFRASFRSICDGSSILRSPDALDELGREDLQTLTLDLLSALQSLRASRLLCSASGDRNLYGDLLRLNSAVNSGEFDVDRTKPLLNVALADKPDDSLIWNQNTSGLVNSSESRQNVDPILKLELEHVYVGVPNFHKALFGDVPDLDVVSEAVFRSCTEGDNPLFKDGWSGWPAGAKESDVLTWFGGLIPKLEEFAGDRISRPAARRKLLAQPRTPLVGSIGKRSMDIGFVNNDITCDPNPEDLRYRWSHILIAGELKSNPKADIASIAWIDLARYAREVFAAQDTRRFVLGFTLCGSLMRVWEFDRLGGIASEQFDINKKHGALQFATTILGFLRMNKEMLGFDPTIITSGGQQYIEIERNDKTERLIIDDVMNADDDIQNNVRKRLDVTKATNYRSGHAMLPSGTSASSVSRRGQSSGAVKASTGALPNRVHRRLILRDFGKPIYKAKSRTALLAALESCIEGHQSLHEAGLLHRDISINNLMINEDDENPSWQAFLIDLDLAIREQRQGALLGDQHSFMHDLESFFWVFFWPLAQWVNRLRRELFPGDKPWQGREDPGLYVRMRRILQGAQQDPAILARRD